MCIDWEQLNTGNCHQNADLQKVEQAVEKSAWSRQYGFVDAVPPAALETRQMLLHRKDWGVRPGPLSHLGSFHLIVHWYIKQLYAMLKDVKKTGLHCTLTDSDCTRTAPPCNCLLQGQSFYKRGPRSRLSLVRPRSPLAFSSLGYLFPNKTYSTSRLHFQTCTIGKRRKRRDMLNVNLPPRLQDTEVSTSSGGI